jgi:hypothetical protein
MQVELYNSMLLLLIVASKNNNNNNVVHGKLIISVNLVEQQLRQINLLMDVLNLRIEK